MSRARRFISCTAQAGADVVALLVDMWETRECNMHGTHTMVSVNQLQMFPVKPAKLFHAPRLCCKVMPFCKFNLERVCLV